MAANDMESVENKNHQQYKTLLVTICSSIQLSATDSDDA